jgi:hypothetical protein
MFHIFARLFKRKPVHVHVHAAEERHFEIVPEPAKPAVKPAAKAKRKVSVKKQPARKTYPAKKKTTKKK